VKPDLDLFGNPLPPLKPKLSKNGKKKRDETPRGYAAPPGSGPEGFRCKQCEHFRRITYSKTYFKCDLLRPKWTHSFATDIRANSPSCKYFKYPETNT
jgi:hypothetical protein